MQTRMVDLMEEMDEATEVYALLELQWREVCKSARDANEKWEERNQELVEFRERRDRWIHFLRRRISEGAGTGRRAEKEEGLLRRVLGKGMTLARAVVEAKEQVAWELEEKHELERMQELAMMRACERHEKLEDVAAGLIQAVHRGTAAGARGATGVCANSAAAADAGARSAAAADAGAAAADARARSAAAADA
eukprot:SAG11_NODE_12906_length_679_cov_3.767241_1_plen_193_part_10